MTVLECLPKERGEPAWDIAHLFPLQGEWTVEEYLALDTNHLVEYANGYVAVLPMPSPSHQRIVFFLQRMLWLYITDRCLGEVLSAPLPVELWSKKFREPDLIFVSKAKLAQQSAKFWRNVDLVVEVVSPDAPGRDYEDKRKEYARAGIAEYWIVDPQKKVVTVLVLQGKSYQTHQEFKPGMQLTSVLLEGFTLPVSDIFTAALPPL
jgi:Uma2 family endonuclease